MEEQKIEDYLSKANAETLRKASKVKMLISDLDGVLTDGGIILDGEGREYKRFQVKDGQIVSYLRKNGIITGIISGRNVPVAARRCEEMGVDFHFHGVRDKLKKVEEILEYRAFGLEACAYIGDDLIDLALLSKVGFSAAPADAMPYIREEVDYVTDSPGGQGAFREVADLLLKASGKLEAVVRECSKGGSK
jgi:3-deoxy-D-manno-octulosonate 8-phosphate phosphatase (KDO 8-P phosphatase)